MAISIAWKRGPWPRYTRDVIAAFQLSVYAHMFAWIGIATVQIMYEAFPGAFPVIYAKQVDH